MVNAGEEEDGISKTRLITALSAFDILLIPLCSHSGGSDAEVQGASDATKYS